MKIVVIGAGAVGGYLAGVLAQAGEDVAVVARGATYQVVHNTGLTLIDVPSAPRHITVPVFHRLADIGDCDVIVVATKALDHTDAFAALTAVPDNAVVIPLQNSVQAPHFAAEIVGKHRVWPGVVRGFLHHTAPGVVEFHGGPLSLTFGTWDGTVDPRAQDFANRLTAAGFPATIDANMWADLWTKAMFVSSMSLLGALTAKPIGKILADPRLATELQGLMAEVAAVAHAEGVLLPADIVDTTMGFAAAMPPDSTSSLQRDLLEGKHAELDAQVGAIVDLAVQHNVAAPRYTFGYALLQSTQQH